MEQKEFGALVTKVITKNDLSREEALRGFTCILNNETTDLQQGAFFAALVSKGETAEEVAACWEAVYNIDTAKVSNVSTIDLVENCGTGMDSYKTFNISTGAALIAASCGVPMARHGARAISSVCGTVDIVERLGVDVECHPDLVTKSIKKASIGLFNGMSPQIHPQALGRILSGISFGTTLNISASLANPALPKIGVRGVYKKELLRPVLEVMKEIGYKRAITIFGEIAGEVDLGMDEASVCGITHCAELKDDGSIEAFTFSPEDFNLGVYDKSTISPSQNLEEEAVLFLKTINGVGEKARIDALILNAALILYVSGKVETILEGVDLAKQTIENKTVLSTLINWVKTQNTDPQKGIDTLKALLGQIEIDV